MYVGSFLYYYNIILFKLQQKTRGQGARERGVESRSLYYFPPGFLDDSRNNSKVICSGSEAVGSQSFLFLKKNFARVTVTTHSIQSEEAVVSSSLVSSAAICNLGLLRLRRQLAS